jgi:hypothetical protein
LNKKIRCSAILLGGFIFLLGSCVQQYNPPTVNNNYNYLVVDGLINSGQDSTYFTLSRTQPIFDSSQAFPAELNASVTILGSGSDNYALTELGNGLYGSPPLPLNPQEQYQVRINTSNGEQYLSDLVTIKTTPPIDSISWNENDAIGVPISISTHDPLNYTRYYRWTYEQTWEHRSTYSSLLIWENGQLSLRDQNVLDGQQIWRCWSTLASTNILIGNSANLSQDIIYEFPLLVVPEGSVDMVYEYSLLVKQYALTEDAYNYWQLLKSNTEQLGTIFSPLPSQLTGNIHCLNNPSEPVLGYISASSVQESRILISRYQLDYWEPQPPQEGCSEITVPDDSTAIFYGNPISGPYYVPITGLLGASLASTIYCGDCLIQGGTNIIPSYWPN